jgi:hypothetical protein
MTFAIQTNLPTQVLELPLSPLQVIQQPIEVNGNVANFAYMANEGTPPASCVVKGTAPGGEFAPGFNYFGLAGGKAWSWNCGTPAVAEAQSYAQQFKRT